MKVMYKGFELEAKREKCLAGYSLLYFTIYQDGYEHVCNFEDSCETIRNKINDLKEWVDDFINMLNEGMCPECCELTLIKSDTNTWKCIECEETFHY